MSLSSDDTLRYYRAVNGFRLPDLQLVLSAGLQPLTGNKPQLTGRICQIIGSSLPARNAILAKIREIAIASYNSTEFVVMSRPSAYYANQRNVGVPSALPRQLVGGVSTANSRYRAVPMMSNAPPHMQPTDENVKRVSVVEQPYFQIEDPSTHYIVPPTLLRVRNAGKVQEITMSQAVGPELVRHILTSHGTQPTALPRIEVVMRFYAVDSSEIQQDEYPDELEVTINKYKVDTMPPVNPPQRVGSIGKRNSKAADITMLVQQQIVRQGKYQTGQPTQLSFNVRWTNSPPTDGQKQKSFMFQVAVVRHVTSNYLIEEYKKMPKTPSHITRDAIIAYIATMSSDDDIQGVEEVEFSLKDVLAGTRLRMPARGDLCTHFNVFDMINWLKVNEKRPTCKCPICNKRVTFSKVREETYFTEILSVCSERAEKVKVFSKGNWVAYDDKGNVVCKSGDGGAVEGLQKVAIKQVIVDLDGPASTSADEQMKPAVVLPDAAARKRATPTDDIITLDSDDDETMPAPPAKKSTPTIQKNASPSPPQDPEQRRNPPPPVLTTVQPTRFRVDTHVEAHGKCVTHTMLSPPSLASENEELHSDAFLNYDVVRLFITRTPPNHRYKVLSAIAEAFVAVDEMAVAAGVPAEEARSAAVAVWPSKPDLYRDPAFAKFTFTDDKKPYYSDQVQAFVAPLTSRAVVELFVSAATQSDAFPTLVISLPVKTASTPTAYMYETKKLGEDMDNRLTARFRRRVEAFMHQRQADMQANTARATTVNAFRNSHAQAAAATHSGSSSMQTQRAMPLVGASDVNAQPAGVMYGSATSYAVQQQQQYFGTLQQQQLQQYQAQVHQQGQGNVNGPNPWL